MSASDERAIGIDIGGTKIAFALVDRDGRVSETHQLPARVEQGPEAIVEAAAEGARLLLEKAPGPVRGIGVGVPGFVQRDGGMVRDAVNLGWRDMPLGPKLEAALGLPVWVQNDVNALLEGELRFGAARGCTTVALAAIGTGLGGAIAVNGEVVSGSYGAAAEVGHLAIMPGGRLCGCGLHGCIEAYCSGTGLASGVVEHAPRFPDSPLAAAGRPPARAVLAAAEAGDALAQAALADLMTGWQALVLVYTVLINPERILIGGGLGLALAPQLLAAAEQALQERALPGSRRGLTLALAEVESPAVGAAAAAFA